MLFSFVHRCLPLLASCTLLCSMLSGCAPQRRDAPWLPDEVAVAPAEQAVFQERVVAQSREVASFRGLFKTSARRGEGASSFRQAIVFEQPDSVRIEALPPQGAVTLHLLVSHEGRVTVVIPGERRAIRGRSSTALFRQYLDLPFREAELMALISGRVERATFEAQSEVRCGKDLCAVRRTDGRYVWRFERQSGRLISVSIRDPLKLSERVRVHYGGYHEFDGVTVPKQLTLELPQDRVVIAMDAVMVRVNQPIQSALFEVAVPSDYSVVE